MKIVPAAIFVAAAVSAQTFTSTTTGVVTDASNAPVSNAKVSITNKATRETRAVESNATGRYTFSRLAPGKYTLRVTQAGFTNMSPRH